MRVLLLNQYFYPDIAATAQLAADLGAQLAQAGHEVIAVASQRGYAADDKHDAHESHDGVEIVRVPATALGRGNRLFRSIDYASFLAAAARPVLLGPRPDVIVALSTPPLVATLALLAQQLRGSKLIFWVMDVYPELAFRLGALDPDGAPAKALSAVSHLLLTKADGIIALDDAMRDLLIAAGAESGKVEVIDNWCDERAIHPAEINQNSLRAELALGDRFTVSYSGNMGIGHDFATITAAMARLRNDEVAWLFIGDGPRLPELQRAVETEAIPHVHFLPYRPRETLNVGLTAAHASLVSLERDLAGLLVPSKLYGILAAGVPVLYVGPPKGRVHTTVVEAEVGRSVRNGDVDGLVAAVRELKADVDKRREMGRRARAVFVEKFDQRIALAKHQRFIERIGAAAC